MQREAPDAAPSKVTAAHLRRADRTCARRLSLDQQEQRGNRPSSRRFEVANRLTADVRLAHTEGGTPDDRAFVVPTDLVPEQQRLYAAGARGYLACFGDRPARLLPADTWATEHPDLGVRLVGDLGIALERPDGGRELRVLRLDGRSGRDRLDEVEVTVAVLRAAPFAGDRFELVAADLLTASATRLAVDVVAELPAARAWLVERLGVLRDRTRRAEPTVGADCQGCPFVAGCPPHRDR